MGRPMSRMSSSAWTLGLASRALQGVPDFAASMPLGAQAARVLDLAEALLWALLGPLPEVIDDVAHAPGLGHPLDEAATLLREESASRGAVHSTNAWGNPVRRNLPSTRP